MNNLPSDLNRDRLFLGSIESVRILMLKSVLSYVIIYGGWKRV